MVLHVLRAFSRSAAVLAAGALALQCGAQQRAGAAADRVLASAIEALRSENYTGARTMIAALERAPLSPYERSRVEQILFEIAYHERQFDDAHAHLQRAIDAGGLEQREVAHARYQQAQMLMAEERWQEGVAALETWLAAAVQPPSSAYYLLAVGYYQSGDFEKALPAVRAAIDRMEQPQESWLTLQLAVHLQKKQFQDALPLLNRLIVVAPGEKRYWLQLSSVYGQLEDYGNALAVMQLAYDNGMLTERAELLRLADLCLFNEVPLRAARALEESLTAGKLTADETVYSKLGNAWIEAREFERAVAPLELAAELAPTGARFVRLGEVHMQLEQWAMAEAALNRAIAKGGIQDPAQTNFLMGVAILSQGRLAEAMSWFEQSRTAPSHRDMADRYIALIADQTRARSSL